MGQGKTTRADHEQLAQIAKTFAMEGDQNARALGVLGSRIDVLRGGDWVGAAAQAFYKEADSTLLPAYRRLIEALNKASQITREISADVQRTEEEIARVLEQDEQISGGDPGQGTGDTGGGNSGGGLTPGGSGAPGSGGGGGGSGLAPFFEPPSGSPFLERLWNYAVARYIPQVEKATFDIDIVNAKWDVELKLKWPPDLKIDLEHRGLLDQFGIQPSPVSAAGIDNVLNSLGPVGSVASNILLGGRTTIEFGGKSFGIGSKGFVGPGGTINSLTGANVEMNGLTITQQTIVGDKDFGYTSSRQVKLGMLGAEVGITEKGPNVSFDAQVVEIKQSTGFNYDGKNYSAFVKGGLGLSEGLMIGKDGVAYTQQLPTPVPLNVGGGVVIGDAIEPVSLSPGKNAGITITPSPETRALFDLLGQPRPVEEWKEEF
jgi:WXG100 family type VII secretion target